jgi:hypothetical protein
MREIMRKIGIVFSAIVILFSIWFATVGIPFDIITEGNEGATTTQLIPAPITFFAAFVAILFGYGLINKHSWLTYISVFLMLVFSFAHITIPIGKIYLPITTFMLIFGIFAMLPKGPPKIKKAARAKRRNRPSNPT